MQTFAEQSRLYVDIFSKMERLPQLLKYYHNCLKVSLVQEWRRIIELSQDENITYWLRLYYDKLLSTWHDQVIHFSYSICRISNFILNQL